GVPHEVLAFYYTWYGRPERQDHWVHWGGENTTNHSTPQTTHYPARGAYDSQDPALVDAHILEAKSSGVSGFIATWWGQGTYEDRSFALLLARAEQKEFKASLYWETAPGSGREQIDGAIADWVYVLSRYGANKAFLKVDQRPVIFVYGRVMGQVPLASWPAIIEETRAQAGDFLLIADGYQPAFARLFDGVHTYNNCAEVKDKSPDVLRTWAARNYADAVSLSRQHRRISCVTVIPGYDDTKVRKPGLVASRQDGQTYAVLWEEAIRAQPDWVLITSWNEWHEGSEIEPSWENSSQYLKVTAKYAPGFLAGKPSRLAARAEPTPVAATNIQAQFSGCVVGALPDLGEAAFWLNDAGLRVRELSWADVADPAIFNPRNFPFVLQTGGESYSSAGKVAGDVVPALQQYLAQGGFLISLPSGPFPFYYDTVSDKAAPVADRVGLPVRQGWELPPDGAPLGFQFDTNALLGFPAKAPFPSNGDLRWRPAVQDAANPGDVYVALARLTDANGRSYGDGMAYVEHRAPPLQGGRTLYVWMRMSDVVGQDRLLWDVLQFAAAKMKPSPGQK
ncbi:MAG: glycoside hydrolase family 99-like domain-containing protein, partial [Verrucomicrobiota bacterium]